MKIHGFVAGYADPSVCRECGEPARTEPHIAHAMCTWSSRILQEAAQASTKYDPFNSRHEAHSVILEELDEFWDLVKMNPNKPMVHPTKGTPLTAIEWRDEMRTELMQTAAMCLRALHDLP